MGSQDESKDLAAATARLGWNFRDTALLDQALTHPSASSPARPHNQRMEFLGDRVLGLIIAEALMARYPTEAEGALAPRLNDLVRKETCADVARDIGLDQWLRLGKSESQTGGRRKTALLGDAMEAVIAAVYMDGGIEPARTMILRFWGDRLVNQQTAPRDAKTALQEWAQARGMAPPAYEAISRTGPDHAPVFTIRATLASGETTTAQAPSKRAGEQSAAAAMLKEIEQS
ncbi:MAG: ribonuclease III [Pikeienuella sp.]